MLKKLVAMWRCLLAGQVDEERGDDQLVRPPQDAERGREDAVVQAAERDREEGRDERPRHFAVGRDLEDLGEELGGDEPADHGQDQEAVATVGQALRAGDEPALEGPGDRSEDADGDDVLHPRDHGPDEAVERDRRGPSG